jgi:hypothetical protein
METFKITIDGGRHKQTVTIIENSYDDTAVNATIKALESYRMSGLSRSPHNDELSVRIELVNKN